MVGHGLWVDGKKVGSVRNTGTDSLRRAERKRQR